MTSPEDRSLSLSEWLRVFLVREQPRHGFAIARLLEADGSLGKVWRGAQPGIYRALQRLEQLSLVRTTEQQATSQGPVRSLIDATPAGREAAAAWLTRPVSHTRDVRSELLVKLALLDRTGTDPQPLLATQREHLAPLADSLHARLGDATGFDRTLVLWRYETVLATIRFLDALSAPAPAR